MKTKIITLLLVLLPAYLFCQNYEKEGDNLFSQAQYEQAEKKYKAAIAIIGETPSIKQKQVNCSKCASLLAKAQNAESESLYSNAAKYYSELYAIHPLDKYMSKANAMKQKANAIRETKTIKGTHGDNISWEFLEGTLTISGHGAIPDVQSISAPWFSLHEKIKSVRISNNITRIGNYAFQCCYALSSITIPNSVTSIGENAFDECVSLGSVIIPDGVKSIGKEAFVGCEKLSSINIPNSITCISEGTFRNCESLSSITIPNGVRDVGNYAFCRCLTLRKIRVFDGITSIGKGAFADCKSLTSITIPSSVTKIGKTAFSGSGLTSITIPYSVTCIEDYTFYNCKELVSVSLPDGITNIGSESFYGCSNLISIIIPNSVTTLQSNAFRSCKSLSIKLPQRFKGKVYVEDCKSVTYY